MHEKHRQRVRKRVRQEGIAHLSDHNVLELLLFFAIPRADTNALAHRLIETFGSLSAVMDAPYEELVRVEGIGEAAATLLMLLPQLTRRYLGDQGRPGQLLGSIDEIKEYAINQFIGETKEIVYLLCLDGRCKYINCCRLAEGSMTAANLDARHIMETALRNKASSVALMHNHPNGVAAPSYSDVEATRRVVNLLATVNIRLVDHQIVAQREVFSMAETEKFSALFV